MIIVLLTLICLYSGINFYFFFRVKSILHLSGIPQAVFLGLIIVLLFSPILTRILESLHYEILARIVAGIGYVWMGFIFLFFFSSVSLELARVIYRLMVPGTGAATLKMVTFGLAAFLSAALVAYGYVDAQRVRVKNLEIKTDRILPGDGKLRIVQISDVHIGIIIRNHRLDPILKHVREANPDILVSTGDLLDGELDNIMKDAGRFAAIPTKYGKFAVLGNHEYYAGLKRSIEFTEAAGFTLLRDNAVQAAGINIFGEDDITSRSGGIRSAKSLAFKKTLAEKRDGFTLLLKHQPFVDETARFDLQLSGHTHGGQLIPFGIFVKVIFPKIYGLHRPAADKLLYISRGTGTWGPPVRILAPPEITVIDLIGKKSR